MKLVIAGFGREFLKNQKQDLSIRSIIQMITIWSIPSYSQKTERQIDHDNRRRKQNMEKKTRPLIPIKNIYALHNT